MSYFSFIRDRIAEFTTIEWLGLAFAAVSLVIGIAIVRHVVGLCRHLDDHDRNIL